MKDRRAGRLRGPDSELFSGAVWSASKSLDLGLIDGVTDMRSKLREMHGEKVVLKVVPLGGGGLLSKLRRAPGFDASISASGLPDEIVSALETRALWARYGL